MSIFKIADKFKNTLTSASTQMKWDLHKTADYASTLADSVDSPETHKLAEQTYELWSMVAGNTDNITCSQIKTQLKKIVQLSEYIYAGLKKTNDKKQLSRLIQTVQNLQPMDLDTGLQALATPQEASRYLQQLGKNSLGDLTDNELITYYKIKDPTAPPFKPVPKAAPQEETPSPGTPPASGIKPKVAPAVRPAPRKTLLNDGDYINPDIQRALIKIFPGSEKWIKIDGIMGPNTRGALNRYKTTYHDDRNMTDPTFQTDVISRGERAEVERAINRPLNAGDPWTPKLQDPTAYVYDTD